MAKEKFNMSEADLLEISMKYAKYTNTDPEAWSKYIRRLEDDGKFTEDNFTILEELSGGKGQEYASCLSVEITNAQRKAKEEYYSNGESLSKTDSAESEPQDDVAVVHCGFPEDGNEAIKAKMFEDGLLSWNVDELHANEESINQEDER